MIFWGTGPEIGFRRYHSEEEHRETSGTVSRTEDGHSLEVGISACAGVEWFASAWLSLHAEYGLSARYSWSEIIDNGFDDETAKSWTIGSSSVWLGMSVYL